MTKQQRQEFAARLGKVREESGMTKAAFARALQIGDTTLTNYLAGETVPGLEEIQRACTVTGTSVQWLVFGTGPRLTVDIPTAAKKIDERRFFSVLQTLVDQAAELNLKIDPIELGQLLIEFYERPEPFEQIRLDDFRRKLQIMVASRPGS